MNLKGKKVLVIGAGKSGVAVSRFLCGKGAAVVLADAGRPGDPRGELEQLSAAGVQILSGGYPGVERGSFDLVVLSPGVPLTEKPARDALKHGIPVTGELELAYRFARAPIVAVTGTNGKTTTTTLIGEIFKNAGKNVLVGGNIGRPLVTEVERFGTGDLIVAEVSSFQLETATTFKPKVGVILNITPDHLDRHGTMEAYTAAKARIFQSQRSSDVAIFGYDDPVARRLSADAPGRMAFFSMQRAVVSGAYLDSDQIVITSGDSAPGLAYQVVCPRSAIRLRGEHNVLNTLAACAVAGAGYVPAEAMRAAIEAFTGVEHRLETVATIGGVTWVNDSIATAPERVIAALRSYREPVVLLAGGRDKNLLWDEMAALAVARCRAVIAFGEYGPQVAEHIQRARREVAGARLERVEVVAGLDEAVAAARRCARPGDVVLLSPGGTSYDAYVDFAARGQHFRDLVRAMSETGKEQP